MNAATYFDVLFRTICVRISSSNLSYLRFNSSDKTASNMLSLKKLRMILIDDGHNKEDIDKNRTVDIAAKKYLVC